MKQSKKRWAWTARQRRPYRKQWYSRPDTTHWYHRLAQRKHRSQTRQGLILIRQGAEEGHVVFPYHHHWLGSSGGGAKTKAPTSRPGLSF